MKCFIVGTNLRESGNEREQREGREKRERNGSKRHEKDTYQKIPLSTTEPSGNLLPKQWQLRSVKKRQIVIANTTTESDMIYFEQITLYSHILYQSNGN